MTQAPGDDKALVPAPERPSAQQQRAMDPGASAWVSANAGSGKTFVLTRRVLRLMLAGAHPSTVLSLTFTKTAAAQMAEKVFAELARWTQTSDAALTTVLDALTGNRPNAAMLTRARTLFAEAVETPGRLKIQTIHAFCESLLHRFPIEAGVPVGFRVLDEVTARQLLDRAISDVFESEQAAALRDEIDRISTRWNETDLRDQIIRGIHQRDAIDAWARRGGSFVPDEALAALRRDLGLKAGDTAQSIIGKMIDGSPLPRSEWESCGKTIGSAQQKIAENLLAASQQSNPANAALAYARCFLNKDLSLPSRNPVTKKMAAAHPDLAARLEEEWIRVDAVIRQFFALDAFETTRALLKLTWQVGDRYAALKRQWGGLDFDDLIQSTRGLLRTAEDVQWVMYKLDRGIRHVLVDEAQDTSPAQWAIIQALTDEFFAGDTAEGRTRTAFAVGDPKQSIFSFQGAQPAGFNMMGKTFEKAAQSARQSFHPERLLVSYRSTPDILEAVDQVFADPENATGLDPGGVISHQASRSGTRGFVDLWPLVPRPEKTAHENWRAPLDAVPPDNPEVLLAGQIATFVRDAIAQGATLPGSGRNLTAADVLILVRTRTGIAKPLIRKLKEAGLEVAGADRLKLLDSIAVSDLLAAAQCALMPQDDYALACLLKSPLFGWTDDGLTAIAINRPGSLIAALQADDSAEAQRTFARLEAWQHAATQLRPYEFFAAILGAEGGRRAFAARLGPEAEDALDAFMGLALNYERESAGSLAGFGAWVQATDTEIKRDMEAAGRTIRVMTAHGAKGLEAPMVILADAGKPLDTSRIAKNLHIDTDDDNALAAPREVLVMPRKQGRIPFSETLRVRAEQRQSEEWRRLLYVAMTRAEDWLILCGTEPYRNAPSWYGLVAQSLTNTLTETPTEPFVPEGTRRMAPVTASSQHDDRGAATPTASTSTAFHDWLSHPAQIAMLPPRSSVSSLARDAASTSTPVLNAPVPDATVPVSEDPASPDQDAPTMPPVLRGTATHRMIELLLAMPESDRPERSQALAERLCPMSMRMRAHRWLPRSCVCSKIPSSLKSSHRAGFQKSLCWVRSPIAMGRSSLLQDGLTG
jgi:ATP-dependent helicase/nuclease subunit A